MTRFIWLGGLALSLAAPVLQAQTPAAGPARAVPVQDSGLDGRLFYQLLLGELNARAGEPAAGFSLMLDAARKTNNEQLYQRSVDIALQARSGDSALQAARAWKQAFPKSREANRYVLQILVALNRVEDSAEPLKAEIALAPPDLLPLAITGLPRVYVRVTDKKLAATIVEQALADVLNTPALASVSWVAIGRMRLAAGDLPASFEATQKAQAADRKSDAPVLLALELMEAKYPQAETVVKAYFSGTVPPDLRMAYARVLLDAQRYGEATQQTQLLVNQHPERADGWLVLGTLQLQDNLLDAADRSLQRFLPLAQKLPQEERSRALAQAYLGLAQIAEKRRNFTAAEGWLAKIDKAQDLMAAQSRRASILAKQGKLPEARQMIRSLPERDPSDARLKLLAEVQLLRDNKQYPLAYDLLGKAIVANPEDADLMYDQALLAEKTGALDDMERLLRRVIVLKPDFQHAYNALGYSLAERNVRLPEARQLIKKALEITPGDPFITDSLGWVEFRMGNLPEAARVLEQAYKAKPDAEIAAHLGEVLWAMGQKEKATNIWKEGMLLNSDNETLRQTLQRLRVKL
ncbi:MAG: tetratricopeptide repeat protein [Pseudomonadota bacterium]